MNESIYKKMFKDRGYEIIKEKYKKFYTFARKKDGTIVCINLSIYENLNSPVIKNIEKFIKDEKENGRNINHMIVISKKKIRKKESRLDWLEVFEPWRLSFDVTEHNFQPKFEKLNISLEEKEKYKFYGKLLLSDPIVKWYDYKEGDVIKITRKDESIYYRVVVSEKDK